MKMQKRTKKSVRACSDAVGVNWARQKSLLFCLYSYCYCHYRYYRPARSQYYLPLLQLQVLLRPLGQAGVIAVLPLFLLLLPGVITTSTAATTVTTSTWPVRSQHCFALPATLTSHTCSSLLRLQLILNLHPFLLHALLYSSIGYLAILLKPSLLSSNHF